MTEVREIVARVLKPEWISQQRVNKYADAILAALAERGISEDMLNRIIRGEAMVVPVEPTEAMNEAGWIDNDDVGPREIWYAMTRAAQEG